MKKKLSINQIISRIVSSCFIAAALIILCPVIYRQITKESLSLKSEISPDILVSESFPDPTAVLNLISQKKYEKAAEEFQFLKHSPSFPKNVAAYFDEYFELEKILEKDPFESAEYLIKNFQIIEKYLSKNKKTSSEIFQLNSIIPFDIIEKIYNYQNKDVRKTAIPKLCSDFKKLCNLYENSIIIGAHSEKMTLKDARILCMKENFSFMRANLRSFGNKNTRISERKEIAFDIVRLKQEYKDFLTEEGKFKTVSRYLEKMQFDCQQRNLKGFSELSGVPDFTALP